MNGLAEIGPPNCDDDLEIVHGLTQAIEELVQPTEIQSKQRTTQEAECVHNKGRIICVSSLKK